MFHFQTIRWGELLLVGHKVKYNGETYIVVHIYNSGFMEIKHIKYRYTVELVNKRDIEVVEK